MSLETLEEDIQRVSHQLLEIVRESCWNKISDNCFYILTEVKYMKIKSFFGTRVERRKLFSPRTPEFLSEVVEKLWPIYHDLYDIDLCVYKAEEDQTILEIQYYLKSELGDSNKEFVKDRKVNIKTILSVPPYVKNANEKFDVNWEFGGFRHQWKMFWWRFNGNKRG